MSTPERTKKPARPQPPALAQISQPTLDKLFAAWCAVQSIGEVLDGRASADPTLMGLGKALQLAGDTLGNIYSEGWNSVPENNTSRIVLPASVILRRRREAVRQS